MFKGLSGVGRKKKCAERRGSPGSRVLEVRSEV